jgi:hypothetical protein
MSTDLAVVEPLFRVWDCGQGRGKHATRRISNGLCCTDVLRSPHAMPVSQYRCPEVRLLGVHAVLTHRDVPAV